MFGLVFSFVSGPITTILKKYLPGQFCDIKLHRSKALKRTVWDFKSADKEKLNEAMENAPWDLPYILYEDLNEIVEFSSSIITSVCAENIRNKSVTI